MVLKKAPKSPWDSKEFKPVNLQGDQPWIFTGKTDAEVETPVFWSSDVNRWLIGKVSDAGKDWGQKEKTASEDEMTGQHHWYKENELGQTPGDDEEQGSLVCCSPWDSKELDTNARLNNSNNSKVCQSNLKKKLATLDFNRWGCVISGQLSLRYHEIN